MVTQGEVIKPEEDNSVLSSLESRFNTLRNRTPEEIATARDRVLAHSLSPRALPPGKTLEDVIVGQLPDDASDEEIIKALKDSV